MRMTRNRAAPVLLLACMLAACVDHPPTSVLAPESLPARERQALAQLQALGYRGPVMFTESRAMDDLGEHPPFWTLGVNEQGVRLLADARAAKSPHAAALDGVLAASESTDPDQIDAGNNTPTSQLLAGNGIRPSIRSSRCNSISTMNIRTRLYAPDWSTGQYVQLQEADILELRFTPRANAAGHYHGGNTISDVRVGTFTPASGRMTGGVWEHAWNVPEFSQEFRYSIEASYTTPSGSTMTEWMYSDDVFVSRYVGLVRIPPNDVAYDRVGGTSTHPEHLNDWGHPELVEKMQRAAVIYHRATGDRTRVNDMSLQYGGRFDIGGGWGGSHREHRFAEVDTRPYNWTPAGRRRFQAALVAAGFPASRIVVEGDHFHVRANASPFPSCGG